MLHGMYLASGEEWNPPIRFVPGNAGARGLIIVDNVAYASTSHSCGAATNGVYALDLGTKQVKSWGAKSDIVSEPSVGPDGTIYVATGDGEVVALAPKTLAVKDTYQSGKQPFTSAPVIFEYKDRVLMAASTKDGRLHLLDTKSLGGTDHQTPVHKSEPSSELASYVPGALASWQDSAGTRWILAPRTGAIAAYKVTEQGGNLTFENGWVSRAIDAPLTPMVINGVVFSASGGSPSGPAVLYALDGATGKELWNSGRTITSLVKGGGIAAGNSQVYLPTEDGTIYAFGFPIER
jgi:outer membrane protein assembly factor BamB